MKVGFLALARQELDRFRAEVFLQNDIEGLIQVIQLADIALSSGPVIGD